MGRDSALALVPGLIVCERECEREDAALKEIACWAGQFTPAVSLDPPACVLLEVQASLRLFGGAEALAGRIRSQCRELGFHAELAGAPTPLAARWLARAGDHALIPERTGLDEAIDRLPLDVLDCPDGVLELLWSIGALTLGDCRRLPRQGLARRGALAMIEQIDRALGRLPDPRPGFVAPATHAARLELTVPQAQAESLIFAAGRLVTGLAAWLTARHAGVERFTLRLEHEHAEPAALTMTLGTPSRDASRLMALVREHLARLDLLEPVCALVLQAQDIEPLAGTSRPLFARHGGEGEQVAMLLERLRARLGDEAVYRMESTADHRPEYASRAAAPGCAPGPDIRSGSPRPLWLLAQPRRLVSRESRPWLEAPLRLLAGPERIESGWWDESPAAEVRRDYFIAAGAADELLWVYRELATPQAWYLHGIFA